MFLAAGAKHLDFRQSLQGIASRVYYVAITVARLEARICTDGAGQLPLALQHVRLKHAALDLERS